LNIIKARFWLLVAKKSIIKARAWLLVAKKSIIKLANVYIIKLANVYIIKFIPLLCSGAKIFHSFTA